MKTSLRSALLAVTLGAVLAATGCSESGSPSPTGTGKTDDPSPTTSAEISVVTPSPTAKKVSGITVPKGWENSKDWMDRNANKVWGLKSGVAVFSGVGSSANTLTSYDKSANLISKSLPVSGIPRVRTTDVFSSYVGGKSYLVLMQTGEIPAEGAKDYPSGGIHYSIMDADTGKIVHEKLHDTKMNRDIDPRSDGSSVSFIAFNHDGIPVTHVLNPVTGSVEATAETKDRRWMARVDGVDIYADYNPDFPRIESISTSAWKIFGAKVDSVSGPREELRPVVSGKYVNLATESNSCMVIDVHTGAETKFSVGNPDLCMTEYESPVLDEDQARLYFGVLPMTDASRNRSYMNPETGKLTKITSGDTFVGAFTGGDGIVYGVSSPGTAQALPSKLDTGEGKPETLGAEPQTGLIHAASGDGVIAIPTSESSSNTEYLFLAN